MKPATKIGRESFAAGGPDLCRIENEGAMAQAHAGNFLFQPERTQRSRRNADLLGQALDTNQFFSNHVQADYKRQIQ